MRVISLAAALWLAGCTYYVAPGPASFDRSWYAAVGAMRDQGVEVTSEDQQAGIARGRIGGAEVSVRVVAQADGSVRVEFNTPGSSSQDRALIERISRAYDLRMGR